MICVIVLFVYFDDSVCVVFLCVHMRLCILYMDYYVIRCNRWKLLFHAAHYMESWQCRYFNPWNQQQHSVNYAQPLC